MKNFLFLTVFLLSLNSFAQKNCEYSQEVNDSLGSYKSTKEYVIYEQNFAGNSDRIYFSLEKTDGLPLLSVQFINKNNNFVKALCLDKNSKIYFQLNSGKIITLISIDKEDCGTMVLDEKKNNTRIQNGFFMFMKGSFEDLKSSPINFMRIKFVSENKDYVISKNLQSEIDNNLYEPENYFINYLKCIE